MSTRRDSTTDKRQKNQYRLAFPEESRGAALGRLGATSNSNNGNPTGDIKMRSMADFVLAACLLASVATVGTGAESAQQSSQADSASVQAAAAYDAKDWAKSAQLYEPMVQAHPEIPRLWFRLATSQQELGQLDQALQTMEQGLKAGVPPVFAEFSIATIYAQKGDKEKTFEHLQKALDAGYNKLEQFDSDAHLASLRGDPRLAKMRQEVEHNLKPCASTPENR